MDKKPITLGSDKPVFFDVDDTLIIWPSSAQALGIDHGEFYKKAIEIGTGDLKMLAMPHEKHIQFMRNLKCQGAKIVVWSHGGEEWAKTVVETLELELYVDLILSKPSLYIDDLDASKWMGRRMWHHPTKSTTKDPETK
jgi:FMN phosphatase YigB (HAD superfamily)